jgi:hypothetical protein
MPFFELCRKSNIVIALEFAFAKSGWAPFPELNFHGTLENE